MLILRDELRIENLGVPLLISDTLKMFLEYMTEKKPEISSKENVIQQKRKNVYDEIIVKSCTLLELTHKKWYDGFINSERIHRWQIYMTGHSAQF